MDKEIIIIAGVAKNRVIGDKGKLPWHIIEDLKHFKELTWGCPVIMGRATYRSILEYLGGHLPGRINIVLTDNPDDKKDGFITCSSIDEALTEAEKHGKKIYVIGGQSVYEQFMDKANKLELTEIYRDFEGDAYFPELDSEVWREVKREDKKGKNFEFGFVTYERKKKWKEKLVDNYKSSSVLTGDDSKQIEILNNQCGEKGNDVNNSKGGGGKDKKGIFIAFEGVDGCGKSTQIRKLAQHIFEKDKHNHVILTRNPYKDVDIRRTIVMNSDPSSDANKLADLFIADRRKQVEEIVKPNLERGHFVLTDRYKLSTISYQTAQGLKMEDLIEKQIDLPVPDMIFIIDVSAEEADRRMKKEDVAVRGAEHKFEAHLDFTEKLRKNYRRAKELLEKKGEKIFIVNGLGTPDEVFERVRNIFDKEFVKNTGTIKAANVLFYGNDGNILLQNRDGISKWGEEYHFFGGHIKEGETPEQAVKREIKEEMGIELNNVKLFKRWPHHSKEAMCNFETFVFVAPIPPLKDLNVTDGKAEVMKFNESSKLKMVSGYRELLQEIFDREIKNEL